MVEVTLAASRELAHEAFGEWTMVRADAGWAAAAVAHEPTRRFLVEVGLPVQTTWFEIDEGFFAQPAGPATAAVRELEYHGDYAGWLVLGREPNNGGSFLLDPVSGRVDTLSEGWGGLQASSAAILVYVLAYFEIHRKLDGVALPDVEPFEAAAEANYEMFRHFSLADPPAFAGIDAPPYAEASGGELDQGHAWEWMADCFAWGGFEDWTWGDEALRYFAARGVDPAERSPSRVGGA